MTYRRNQELVPRNGHTLVVGIVARISGCASQKEMSLDDQVDHGKEEVAELYEEPVDYRVIATKGKGENRERPELAEIESLLRTKELDLLVMEDAGRLIRGTEAVNLWGIAVDNDTRCIAPNDCLDTIGESWEEDLIAACRDHVGHNSHTSKRIKKKQMNRFKKGLGATPCEIAGYIKPGGVKTYDGWQKVPEATAIIVEGAQLLLSTLNCSRVADFFNNKGFPVGKYCQRPEWDGKMVRRFYSNTLLKGMPGRGYRHTVKHHESGRRVAVPNPEGPTYIEYPHLAHLEESVFDNLNSTLEANNRRYGRKPVNGIDSRWRIPRSRTRFPGQHARCWHCGKHCVWGGNGMTENLMCSGSREWRCWNSIGFSGARLSRLLVDAIQQELYQLDGFEEQFAELVHAAGNDVSAGLDQRWQDFNLKKDAFNREKDNLATAIREVGPRPMLCEQMDEIEQREKDLAREKQSLELLGSRKLQLPQSTAELRQLFAADFERLTIDSPEFADLFCKLVPDVFVYPVRLCDGGHLLPRAKVTVNLAGISSDTMCVPGLAKLLTRDLTFDLFDPPQRERIREEAVRLDASGYGQKAIAAMIEEHPTATAVHNALKLARKMNELGLDNPYVVLQEPPEDYAKLRRHRNEKYCFEPLEGYERPNL